MSCYELLRPSSWPLLQPHAPQPRICQATKTGRTTVAIWLMSLRRRCLPPPSVLEFWKFWRKGVLPVTLQKKDIYLRVVASIKIQYVNQKGFDCDLRLLWDAVNLTKGPPLVEPLTFWHSYSSHTNRIVSTLKPDMNQHSFTEPCRFVVHWVLLLPKRWLWANWLMLPAKHNWAVWLLNLHRQNDVAGKRCMACHSDSNDSELKLHEPAFLILCFFARAQIWWWWWWWRWWRRCFMFETETTKHQTIEFTAQRKIETQTAKRSVEFSWN